VRRFRRRYVPRPSDHRRVDLAFEMELEMEPGMDVGKELEIEVEMELEMDVGKELEIEVEMNDEIELEMMTLAAI
jgi:hypothetical protein